jgi:hypothetical protein
MELESCVGMNVIRVVISTGANGERHGEEEKNDDLKSTVHGVGGRNFKRARRWEAGGRGKQLRHAQYKDFCSAL